MMNTGTERTPRRVAVVAPNWLGDAVMSLPALAELGADASVAVLAPRYTARVFWQAPGVDEVWVDPAGGRMARIRARARALRSAGIRECVILPPSLSSALAPCLAGVAARVGYRADARSLLLTDARPLPPRTTHLATAYLELAGGAGAGATDRSAHPRLHVSASDRASAAELMRRAGVEEFVLLVPGAAYGPAKSWPWARYRDLCARLASRVSVVVTGGPGDRALCERVVAGNSRAANLAGQTRLGQFFALAERARVLVANDSGAPHVSAALGTPTVVLFGSTSPAWTAPLGKHVAVLQHVVHCNPCFRRTCPTQLECFNGIPVEQVEARVLSFLEQASPAPGGAHPVRP